MGRDHSDHLANAVGGLQSSMMCLGSIGHNVPSTIHVLDNEFDAEGGGLQERRHGAELSGGRCEG